MKKKNTKSHEEMKKKRTKSKAVAKPNDENRKARKSDAPNKLK